MTEVNIIEGNKLIAEFMGWEFRDVDGTCHAYFEKQVQWIDSLDDDLFLLGHCYNSDWNKLIEACKKCNELAANQLNRPSKDHCSKLDWLDCEVRIAMGEYDINLVYQAVLQFINYYNKRK